MPRLQPTLPLALLALAAACASNPNAEPEYRPVRVAGMEQPVKAGDCPEARRRAAAKPDLDVDRIPAPVAMKPRPLTDVPPDVFGPKGAVIKADVIIDTLGRPDMKTFRVVASSHPWLSANVRSTIGKWKFTPAELAGCKVARVYHFSASAPPFKTAR
jgi:hypothetical protein